MISKAQKANDPAAAATARGLGSKDPSQDGKMNMDTHTTEHANRTRKIPEAVRARYCGRELIDQLDFALDLLRTASFALQNPEPGALDQGDTVTVGYVVSYACDAINQVRDAIDASRRAAE